MLLASEHIAGPVIDGGQRCHRCGELLILGRNRWDRFSAPSFFPPGAYVAKTIKSESPLSECVAITEPEYYPPCRQADPSLVHWRKDDGEPLTEAAVLVARLFIEEELGEGTAETAGEGWQRMARRVARYITDRCDVSIRESAP